MRTLQSFARSPGIDIHILRQVLPLWIWIDRTAGCSLGHRKLHSYRCRSILLKMDRTAHRFGDNILHARSLTLNVSCTHSVLRMALVTDKNFHVKAVLLIHQCLVFIEGGLIEKINILRDGTFGWLRVGWLRSGNYRRRAGRG